MAEAFAGMSDTGLDCTAKRMALIAAEQGLQRGQQDPLYTSGLYHVLPMRRRSRGHQRFEMGRSPHDIIAGETFASASVRLAEA